MKSKLTWPAAKVFAHQVCLRMARDSPQHYIVNMAKKLRTGRTRWRCAIYTRKSTEHNLDLAFNSLDAQREACEAGSFPTASMMAPSPARLSIGPPSRTCWNKSDPKRSTSLSSTRSTALPGRWQILPS
jgi:hypothetical protein